MATLAAARRPREWWSLPLALLPLVLALVLGVYLRSNTRFTQPRFNGPALQSISFNHARALGALFEGIGYQWPPGKRVPALNIEHFPADMATLPNDRKKRLFFQTLLPIVLAENARISQQRAFVEARFSDESPDSEAQAVLQEIANQYGITKPLDDAAVRKRLLRRVDTVPPALVLAQAAKESGWGTSRFARQANNLFGVWTWQADQGLAPLLADAGATHYVRAFPDLRASVRDYLYNINVGHAYLALRKLRARTRAAGKKPTALQLARALGKYSAHGARYVGAIDGLIRHNDLTTLDEDGLRLAPLGLMARE
jgi:Bax protein